MIPSKTRSQFVSAPPVPTNLPRSFVVVGMGSAYFSSGIEELSTGSLSYCTGVAMRIERNQGDCDRVLAHFGNLLPDTHIECATDNQRVFQSSTLKYFLKYLADEISSAREQSLKCTLVITFGYANRTAGTLRQACQLLRPLIGAFDPENVTCFSSTGMIVDQHGNVSHSGTEFGTFEKNWLADQFEEGDADSKTRIPDYFVVPTTKHQSISRANITPGAPSNPASSDRDKNSDNSSETRIFGDKIDATFSVADGVDTTDQRVINVGLGDVYAVGSDTTLVATQLSYSTVVTMQTNKSLTMAHIEDFKSELKFCQGSTAPPTSLDDVTSKRLQISINSEISKCRKNEQKFKLIITFGEENSTSQVRKICHNLRPIIKAAGYENISCYKSKSVRVDTNGYVDHPDGANHTQFSEGWLESQFQISGIEMERKRSGF